jgi:hypothetical protein
MVLVWGYFCCMWDLMVTDLGVRHLWNITTYIDKFKDLIDLSSYTDPIMIVLKFRQGLNSTAQDRITESGIDRPSDMDFNSW